MSPLLPPIASAERLLVVVGPSGAGKDSVLRAWRERLSATDAEVAFARRVITRPPEANEAHESVDEEAFARLRAQRALATWWQANGLLYGIRQTELAPLAQGAWVVMNGSRAHLPALRAQAPGLRAVAITAPTEVLAERLAQRGREDAQALAQRLARAPQAEVDLTLCNDGTLADTADALHRWWQGQGAASPAR
ncbi:MAG: phosphonate metabolism protein/1,5-bisphosphokinase (PRPP-forming) PhnN [Pseudomonadota bacterium]